MSLLFHVMSVQESKEKRGKSHVTTNDIRDKSHTYDDDNDCKSD